jgi:hypothetical protein|tara:strand:- start:57 stop:212 length:156 start_codon:yes stop_codon:yes gene_type:complete
MRHFIALARVARVVFRPRARRATASRRSRGARPIARAAKRVCEARENEKRD